ncbi:MAG: conjugal transfer protein TraX [Oscillospiraceae bacterium]|nr:conjugal transfer protein TraX [Oscillospiraceae bacterium]
MKLDAYHLKLFAIIAMVLNHIVIAWWAITPIYLAFPMYAVGGITFPIMAFFVVEGYKHTSSLKRYVLRILVVGIIALPFHFLTLGLALAPSLNIMFTIALSLGVLKMYDKIKSRVLFWIIFVLIIIPVSLIFEWSFPGVAMVLLFYIIKKERVRRILPPLVAVALSLLLSLIYLIPGMEMPEMTGLMADPMFALVSATFVIGMALSSVLLAKFNGERGKKMKWLFYAFYPAHLAVLAIVALILGLVNFTTLGAW